jgi:hypothetical protein
VIEAAAGKVKLCLAMMYLYRYIYRMADDLKPIPLAFWRSASGREPVRVWLGTFPREEQRLVGRDMDKVQ